MVAKNMLSVLVTLGVIISQSAAADIEQTGCSLNGYLACDVYAICNDIGETDFECVCPQGYTGNGYKKDYGNGTGTGCEPEQMECRSNEDCHINAECLEEVCVCKTGYDGAPSVECYDINECAETPAICHRHAVCENTNGSYVCECKASEMYEGNGTHCVHKCYDKTDCNMTSEDCNDYTQICECKAGFRDEGLGCVNIDECNEGTDDCGGNATCTDTPGSFTCTCNNGFTGDGKTCTRLHINCHDIKTKFPGKGSGVYVIDPDGEGPIGPVEVRCEMRPNFGITIMDLLNKKFKFLDSGDTSVTFYYKQSLEEVAAIIATAGFCYQEMSSRCTNGGLTMNEGDYWVNGKNESVYSWGGAVEAGDCLCGQFDVCRDQDSACNCDGATDTRYDNGKLIDKEILPIKSMVKYPGPNGVVVARIGNVYCAPESFDILQDCSAVKKANSRAVSGHYLLDFDGKGDLPPVYAMCDMDTCQHEAITEIAHDRVGAITPSAPGTHDLTYSLSQEHIEKLIEISGTCKQYAEYECTNSRILGDPAAMSGYVSNFYEDLKYWPGGQNNYECGCGSLSICANVSSPCNCDTMDGVTRKDFGWLTKDLPVSSVTLNDVGGSSVGTYTIGPLRCSQSECGFEATCQEYADKGHDESYAYVIDPDGAPSPTETGNVDPFIVDCQMEQDPLYGVTKVHHLLEMTVSVTTRVTLTYIGATDAQIQALLDRANDCYQTITYTCKEAPLHYNGDTLIEWVSGSGETRDYLHGTWDNKCLCGKDDPNTCVDDGNCNCDVGDDQTRTDTWTVTNKDDLPIREMYVQGINNASEATMEIGPLVCRSVLPTCSHLKGYKWSVRNLNEFEMTDGNYVIDPDAFGGVEPFQVSCVKTETYIPTDIDGPINGLPDEGISRCYTVGYTSPDGSSVSKAQVQALVNRGRYCAQTLSQDCLNAPLTDHSNFTTCDDVLQPGWGGSQGEDMCACGVSGTCAGDADSLCSCDLEDEVTRNDGGYIVDQSRLAICTVCVSLDPINFDVTGLSSRMVQPYVGGLRCDRHPIGIGISCQEWRERGETESKTMMVVLQGSNPPIVFPVYCYLDTNPNLGRLEIYPKNDTQDVPPTGEIIYVYYVHTIAYIYQIIEQSAYCTQEVVIECVNSAVKVDGALADFWIETYGDMSACVDGMCPCDGVLEGVLRMKDMLPLTTIDLGSATGTRKLTLGPVQCLDLYRNCHEIKLANANTNPFGDDIYTIDPDLEGPIEPFTVICDFDTDRTMGITKVPVVKPGDREVNDQNDPGELEVVINYGPVTAEQINALTQISGFCIQYLQYTCLNSPLINNNETKQSYVTTYGGGELTSFGVPENSDIVGCACVETNTCPAGEVCHCDEMNGVLTVDYGFETNRDILPVTKLNFGGQPDGSSSGMYDFSAVYCGPDYFDLPTTCQNVLKRGKISGEYYIRPSPDVDPFLVYCDMDSVPGKGITVINSNVQTKTNVTYGDPIEVKYYAATDAQVQALVTKSVYCQQGIRYECRNTKLLEDPGYFYWTGSSSTQRENVAGRYYTKECKCAEEGKCGGSEPREELLNLLRRCNCDANDDQLRADAGMITRKQQLPVLDLYFQDPGTTNPYGAVNLGPIMCADEEFDVNECENGFNDCHEMATCGNTEGSYECLCKQGWRGRGRPDVLANGRNCYDDDECSNLMNYCPLHSICTNLPGSYDCECLPGFRPKPNPKTKCVDIDECYEGTHNCHEHADCYNTPGSFVCRCRRNYRGNGTECTPFAQCAVFGDPHIITFDGKWAHFQGTCDYIIAQDNCDADDGPPSYLVTSNFYRKHPEDYASWVYSVTLTIDNFVIEVQKDNIVLVDGQRVNPTYVEPGVFGIYMFGGKLEVITELGIELKSDGKDAIEVYLPANYANETCGMCGNFNGNSLDDLQIGPECPDTGTVTDSMVLYGNSWLSPDSECDANCSDVPEPECPPERKAMAELQCRRIYGQHKVFNKCLLQLGENYEQLKETYYQICVYDLCHISGDVEEGLCPHAAHLFDICIALTAVEFETYRTEHFCPPDCSENQDYNSCHTGVVETCFDLITGSTPTASTTGDSCQEGCFCKSGYVADDDKCVKADECGCMEGNSYYPKDAEITIGDCAQKKTCLGNNTWSPVEDITCHDNATCTIVQGIFGCHCDDGYYGDGVTICVVDPCDPNPCGVDETCVHNLELAEYYECKCSAGFFGDCGNCTELDECQTELNDCPPRSDCYNTPGSYYCECRPGYIMSGGLCADVDECFLANYQNESICGNNTKCVNKIGTYKCPCCAGFEKDENDNCVPSDSETAAEGERCCVCTGPKCLVPGKVCSNDHETYDSWADLIVERCKQGRWNLNYDYSGACQSSCSDGLCPLHQVCHIHPFSGKPTCECEQCSTVEQIPQKVCSSNYDIYESICQFKQAMCQAQSEAVIIENVQVCYEHWGKIAIGPWSDWSECSVTCGKGIMTRSRDGVISEEFKDKYPLFVDKDCYMAACPEGRKTKKPKKTKQNSNDKERYDEISGPCVNNTECAARSAECVVIDDEAVCECPTCENVELEPVCGYVVDPESPIHLRGWDSPCDLKKNACHKQLDHVVYELASCHDEPLSCQLVPELRFVTGGDDDQYISDDLMDLPKCGGGCGQDKELCCQPKETVPQTVTLSNTTISPSTITVDIEIITECECTELVP